MKITIVLGAFFPVPPIMGGGIEKVWFTLAQQFARRGHEVLLISRAIPQFPREEERDGIKLLRVRGFDMPRSAVWLKLLDLIYSLRVKAILPPADIVVPHTFWLPMFLRDSRRGKVYVHVGRYPKGQMRFYRHVARLQAPTADLARAVATEAPALEQKISIVPNPRPSVPDEAPPPMVQRDKTILFVGRVHPEKGVHLLIDAFVRLQSGVAAEWKLIIVGPHEAKHGGGGDYLVDLTRRAANANIVFRGPIFESAQLANEYRNACVFVYPSLAERGESFGIAPLEAMAHGCAVLVSALGCFRDFISAGESGLVFNHRAAQPAAALRQELEHLLVDPALLSRIAAAGYARSADYTLDKVGDLFLSDFESTIASANA